MHCTQIYVLAQCQVCNSEFLLFLMLKLAQFCEQNTLQNTWNGKEKNNESTKNAYDYIAIITLLTISILIVFIANMIQELRGIDSLSVFKLLLFIIYL